MTKNIFVLGAAGRIGRGVTHELVSQISEDSSKGTYNLNLVGLSDIVTLDDLIDNYTGRDPVHGIYKWAVGKRVDEQDSRVRLMFQSGTGSMPHYFCEKDVSKIPFKKLEVDIILDCTGIFGDPKTIDKPTKEQNLSRKFLEYGVQTIIQTYPVKSADAMLIMGVNHDLYNPEKHKIISNASCTTKSLAVPLQVMEDNGIHVEDCRMVTVHAATASQKILESLGQIVTHSTGAAKATGEVMPSLKGKMGGTSARVPTLDGSISYMYLVAESSDHLSLNSDELNEIMKHAVNNPRYAGRLGILESETKEKTITSSDIINRKENALIIPDETQVRKLPYEINSRNVYHITLVSGYDNELGSSVDPVLLANYVSRKTK